jgi:hypothetical protein
MIFGVVAQWASLQVTTMRKNLDATAWAKQDHLC